jgi:hypothetical protein
LYTKLPQIREVPTQGLRSKFFVGRANEAPEQFGNLNRVTAPEMQYDLPMIMKKSYYILNGKAQPTYLKQPLKRVSPVFP